MEIATVKEISDGNNYHLQQIPTTNKQLLQTFSLLLITTPTLPLLLLFTRDFTFSVVLSWLLLFTRGSLFLPFFTKTLHFRVCHLFTRRNTACKTTRHAIKRVFFDQEFLPHQRTTYYSNNSIQKLTLKLHCLLLPIYKRW